MANLRKSARDVYFRNDSMTIEGRRMTVSQVTEQLGVSFAHSMCRVEEKKKEEEN